MLKQRILTALVLAPLIIWGVFSLPALYFSFFILFIIGLASWEWGHLSGINKPVNKALYTFATLLVSSSLIWLLEITEFFFYALLVLSSLWWLYRIILIIRYQNNSVDTAGITQSGVSYIAAFSIIFSIVIPFYSLIYLRNVYNFPGYMFYLLMLIWGADIFAYFAGKHFGKNKLAVKVSPGKTWEGAYGAIAGTFIIAIVGCYFFQFTVNQSIGFIILSSIIVVISIFGDLSESLYKRQTGIKDSGNLLPGHGGILDRADSLMAASPFFVVGLYVAGLLT